MFRYLLAILFLSLTSLTTEATSQVSDVIIYYANETNLTPPARENYRVLKEWMRTDGGTLGERIAGQLESDAEIFPKAVNEEVAAIKEGVAAHSSTNLIMFTNALSARDAALLYHAEKKEWLELAFPVPDSDNYVLSSHPNTQPAVFEAALRLVASVFPATQHRFSLITKSHGSKFFIMVPRITIQHETVDKAKFLDILNGTTAIEGIPPWMENAGITRAEYFEAIDKVGKETGMQFDLVFTESCKSRIGVDSLGNLPNNISALVSPSRDLDYKTIDYSAAFAGRERPAVAIGKQLTKTFPKDIALAVAKESPFKRIFPYWVPLLILILIGTGIKAFGKEQVQRDLEQNA